MTSFFVPWSFIPQSKCPRATIRWVEKGMEVCHCHISSPLSSTTPHTVIKSRPHREFPTQSLNVRLSSSASSYCFDDTSQSFISPKLLELLEASADVVRRSSSLHPSFPLPPSCIPTASIVISLFLASQTARSSSSLFLLTTTPPPPPSSSYGSLLSKRCQEKQVSLY